MAENSKRKNHFMAGVVRSLHASGVEEEVLFASMFQCDAAASRSCTRRIELLSCKEFITFDSVDGIRMEK